MTLQELRAQTVTMWSQNADAIREEYRKRFHEEWPHGCAYFTEEDYVEGAVRDLLDDVARL